MTSKRKSEAMRFLESRTGGPLTFGAFLEAIRVGDEQTQASFAEQLGVSRQHLCDMEKGRRLPSIERAARWAEQLGYSPAQFVQLVLQDEVSRTDLDLKVKVSAA
jgi:transcriptional regulator with XRE-family HTH domain